MVEVARRIAGAMVCVWCVGWEVVRMQDANGKGGKKFQA